MRRPMNRRPRPQPSTAPAAETLTAASVDTRIAEAVRLTEARASARVVVAASQLPAPAKTRLEARFAESGHRRVEHRVGERRHRGRSEPISPKPPRAVR